MAIPRSHLERMLQLPADAHLRKVTWLDETTGGRITLEVPARHAGIRMDEFLHSARLGSALQRLRFHIAGAQIEVGTRRRTRLSRSAATRRRGWTLLMRQRAMRLSPGVRIGPAPPIAKAPAFGDVPGGRQ